jgi:hypothetical protein
MTWAARRATSRYDPAALNIMRACTVTGEYWAESERPSSEPRIYILLDVCWGPCCKRSNARLRSPRSTN